MKMRLLFLIAVAAVLAIYFANVKTQRTGTVEIEDEPTDDTPPEELERIRSLQLTLDKFPLPGSEPPEPADLDLKVEADVSRGKNRLYFTISERHGYYVEQFRILVWSKRPGAPGSEESPLFEQFFDRYLKANETLRLCLEVVPAELARVGGDMGTTEDWGAKITWHGRVRQSNPEPLPPDHSIVKCD